MDLFLSTADFKLNGISYPGLPILIDHDGKVVREAQGFFIKECIKRGRVQSPQSWKKYGQDLYDYLSFCESNDLDWKAIGVDRESTILAAYRDWSLGLEVGNKANTVNARLRTAIRFYRYAHKIGAVQSVPYEIETVMVREPKQFLAHTDATAGIRASFDVMLKTQPTTIRVLSTTQAVDLVKAVSNPAHKLVVRLALGSGLRRKELATFPLEYVIDPATYTKHKTYIRVNLCPTKMGTKGSKARGVDVPRTVMEALWRYVLTERHRLEQISGEKQTALFLTQDGVPYARSGDTLLKIVKEAGERARLPFVNVHVLRHTYATHTLYSMRKRNSAVDPLMYVRDRLGHNSLSTTEKYLHFLSEVEDAVSNSYQEEIDRLTAEVVSA
jgi:integrase/recombinase XerD